MPGLKSRSKRAVNKNALQKSCGKKDFETFALMMSLGERDGADINVRLRHSKDKVGNVFAKDTANVPGKSVTIAMLPVTAKWQVWKTWGIEMEGKGCEVLIYPKDKP